MVTYKFTVKEIEVVKVLLPKDVSTAQIGFIKARLQELHPDITKFRQNGNCLYGLVVGWELKEI